MRVWVADGQRGLMRGEGGQWRRVGPPGSAVCRGGGRVFCAGPSRCTGYDPERAEALLDFALPPGVCALTALGERVYALSSDADSVTAYSARTGDVLISAPAGAYPRGMCASPCGRYLAVAGGAAGEILVLDDQLACRRKYRVAGAACGVCFLPRGIGALCAVGDGELSARLMLIRPSGVAEEMLAWDGVPCALTALTGGRCAAGCHGAVWCLRGDGKVFRRLPCAYPARLRPLGAGALVCDGWQGGVFSLEGHLLYQGQEPRDALILP